MFYNLSILFKSLIEFLIELFEKLIFIKISNQAKFNHHAMQSILHHLALIPFV